jgi:hypothetical protein
MCSRTHGCQETAWSDKLSGPAKYCCAKPIVWFGRGGEEWNGTVERLTSLSEGSFRFFCPGCGKMPATVNPRNNLAHWFCCKENRNNVDLLLTLHYAFTAAVRQLEGWLQAYEARQKPQGLTCPARNGCPVPVAWLPGSDRHDPGHAGAPFHSGALCCLGLPSDSWTTLRHADLQAAMIS